jgi:copper(I)-binding protein
MKSSILLILLVPLLVLAACRQTTEPSIDNLTIEVAVNPDPPAVGDATLSVTLTDRDNKPINDATVNVTGNMSHAGMVPVIAESSEGVEAVYEMPFQWTMGGDWVLTVEVTLANGETTSQEFEFSGVADGMGDMEATEDASGMNMDMGDSKDVSSEDRGVSGAYLIISNNRDTDITLLSASVSGVGVAEIHQTTIENDIMHMEHMADGLLIPAGESIELRPASYHIMLMQLEQDMVEGETVSITLEFDNNTSITLDAPIASENPEDGLTIENDGLTVSGAWVRLTKLAGDSNMNMDMEATEEAGS